MPLSTYKFSTKLFWGYLDFEWLDNIAGRQAKSQETEGQEQVPSAGRVEDTVELCLTLKQNCRSLSFNLTNKQRTWPIHTAQLCWIKVKHNPSMPCVRSPFFPHLILLWVTCTPPYYCSNFQMNSFTPNTPFLLNRNSSERARLKNVPSRSKGWVDFPAGQVMFNIHFSNRQGSKQKNLSLNR